LWPVLNFAVILPEPSARQRGRALISEVLMPTNRIIYTLQDIKILLARIHHVKKEAVDVYEGNKIELDCGQGRFEIHENSYLFQLDK
jgi:hypothetical protein